MYSIVWYIFCPKIYKRCLSNAKKTSIHTFPKKLGTEKHFWWEVSSPQKTQITNNKNTLYMLSILKQFEFLETGFECQTQPKKPLKKHILVDPLPIRGLKMVQLFNIESNTMVFLLLCVESLGLIFFHNSSDSFLQDCG